MAVEIVPASSEDYASYIRDMLRQLADMAGRSGDHRLERSIRCAATTAEAAPGRRLRLRRNGPRRAPHLRIWRTALIPGHDWELSCLPAQPTLSRGYRVRAETAMSFSNRAAKAMAVLAFASTAGLARAQAPQVRIEHAAARVVVIPEARSNISVTVQHGPSRLPPLQVRQVDGRVEVDGGLGGMFGRRDLTHCLGGLHTERFFGGSARTSDTRVVAVEHLGRIRYADLPVITIRAPMHVSLAAGSAVYGEVGRADAAELSLAGCGDWSVADVRGALTVDDVGSGDVRAGSVETLSGRISGSGDVTVGAVKGAADVQLAGSGDLSTGPVGAGFHASLAGSGDVTVASVNGAVDVKQAASGDVHIHGGHAQHIGVDIAGSGDFVFDGVADRLSASVVGSGDVRVAHVTGPVSKSVVGSGEVTVGR